MFILLVASSDSPETFEALLNLSQVSILRDHRLAIFFNSESVKFLDNSSMITDIKNLADRGVRLLFCRTSAQTLGMNVEENMMEGTEISSLGDFIGLMEAADRTLFLGWL